jgi:hypothetical protein
MDYLPIQASAVPCERVFSSSAETDTKKQNRISPLLMEVLQMLKFHLKKEHLNFTDGCLKIRGETGQGDLVSAYNVLLGPEERETEFHECQRMAEPIEMSKGSN